MAHAGRFTTFSATGLAALLLAACSSTGQSTEFNEPNESSDSTESNGSSQSTESGSPSSTTSAPADPSSGLAAANDGGDILVGVTYTANGEQANANAGAGAITRSDEAAAASALIEDINSHGGIAGREIKPVFFGYDAYFAEYPNLYDAGTISQDRMLAAMADSLERQDYFSGWDPRAGAPSDSEPTVAVLSVDEPEWDRPLRGVMLPALEEAGYPVDDSLVIAIPSAATEAELGQASKAVQNAILKLTSAGVTHVIMLDATGTTTLLFGQAASQQEFFPRLGINTATGLQALYDAGVLTAPQLAGAVGLGWLPTIDLPASDGEKYATEAATECLDTVKAATGEGFTSTNAAGLALAECDMVHLTAATLDNIEGEWSLQSAADAIGTLGEDYQSALVPGSGFTEGRQDAVQVGYDMAWDDKCGCVTYVKELQIP